jgi:hypothetical protein
MDEISRGNSAKRSPAWQVLVYDTRSGENTVADVVLGNQLTVLTGPLDVTEFLEVLTVDEKAGDYPSSGVPASTISATFVDPDGQFDPDLVIDDPTALGRFFRRGNVIRVTLGDERVPVTEWVNVFTGRIAGQSGYNPVRSPPRREVTIKAYGREATFFPFERTSDEFKNDGTNYLTMGTSVATAEMGLQAGEINFLGWGNNLLRHASVTLAKENPLSMIAKIMFVDGFLPKFDGSGVLTQTSGLITADSDRFYETNSAVLSVLRTLTEVQPPDSVCVVGLDFNLSRVDQPRQVIGEQNVTTGFFTTDESLEIYWSDDRTKLADNVIPIVLKGVNGGIAPLGGGEEFFPITSPSNSNVGTIGFRVTISTGFAPWVAVLLLIIHVALAAVPDAVIAEGGGIGVVVVGGFTISTGRILQAVSLAAAMIILTKIGRGQYQYHGDPFEYVFATLRECAVVDGVGEFERNEIEIENHLVDNAADAKVIAREMLFRQQARGRPRTIVMLHDLGLEPDDTMELIEDGRRFLVSSIRYQLRRGAGDIKSTVEAFEVTDNISRAT